MNDDLLFTPEAWYVQKNDVIRVSNGDIFAGNASFDVDIRDAVYLRYQLDGAIRDYERHVGR